MSYKFKPTYQPAIRAVAKAICEWGYSDVTPDKIDIAHRNWRIGNEPKDIIERFAFKDFDEHPEHFGEKALAGANSAGRGP